jgi:hypothetical protein
MKTNREFTRMDTKVGLVNPTGDHQRGGLGSRDVSDVRTLAFIGVPRF